MPQMSTRGLDERVLGGTFNESSRRSMSPNFLERTASEAAWFDDRLAVGLDPYQTYTAGVGTPRTRRGLRGGALVDGINFGSQDYLSLSAHPAIIAAVKDTADAYGVHSAGSAALAGNLDISLKLEAELAQWLGYREVTLFPIGWAAGYGLITSIVRPTDHVVIDRLAHACLQEGARSATQNIHRFAHLSNDRVERTLRSIRAKDPDAGILVVTETLFSMDSDSPDIAALQAICRDHRALLVADCAHDLGSLGPDGLGILGRQGMIGQVDILLGAFSKTFASIGGFVACNVPGLRTWLRAQCGPSTFTNAMTPLQVGVIRKAIEIVRSAEGERRRERLDHNARRMRAALSEAGFLVAGAPSAIVPTFLGGPAVSRLATRFCIEGGAHVNLVEYPAVARNLCRWRIQMMADHADRDIDEFAVIAAEALAKARDVLASLEREPVPAPATLD